MGACDKGSRVETDYWGDTVTTYFDHSQTPECFTDQINSLHHWLIGGGVVMLLLVIAVIYLLVSNSKKNIEILNLRFNTQDDANSLRELKGRIDEHDRRLNDHDKRLNDHSSQISVLERKVDIHDGRLKIHFDWIFDLQIQINAILGVFAEFNRLAPRRGAVLTDLIRAVMDQLTPNKNQSNTDGQGSTTETTDGK